LNPKPDPKAGRPATALDLDRLVIVGGILLFLALTIAPFYVLYFRLVQRLLP
jgi:hypothetical protein